MKVLQWLRIGVGRQAQYTRCCRIAPQVTRGVFAEIHPSPLPTPDPGGGADAGRASAVWSLDWAGNSLQQLYCHWLTMGYRQDGSSMLTTSFRTKGGVAAAAIQDLVGDRGDGAQRASSATTSRSGRGSPRSLPPFALAPETPLSSSGGNWARYSYATDALPRRERQVHPQQRHCPSTMYLRVGRDRGKQTTGFREITIFTDADLGGWPWTDLCPAGTASSGGDC